MKKLMILGGSHFAMPVIKAARELGLYVITCDYLPGNYAHQFADRYVNVSIVEQEAVLQAARELDIDGITAFGCDPGVVSAAYVADKMGLPTCGPLESVQILQNKGLFRAFLKQHGFVVPESGAYRTAEQAKKELENYRWPVIVKPADSCGSKGVTRIERPEQLEQAAEAALRYSQCGEFIVEEFIQQKGQSSDTDCFSVDGELKFVSYNAQYFDADAENPYTPAAFAWHPTLSAASQRELTSELQRLLRLLHMGTSLYNIESREGVDGRAYLMECSPRGGGNRLAECLEYATGVRLVENTVRAAMGIPLVGMEQKPYDGYWAEVILHSAKSGVFRNLWIDPSIQDNIVERDLWKNSGDRIGGFAGANEAIGTLIMRYESLEKMEFTLNNINTFVRVIEGEIPEMQSEYKLLS